MAKKKEEKPESKKETPEETKTETPAAPSEDFTALKKELGELKEAQAKTQEFVGPATLVVKTLAEDPALRQAFQDKLKQGQSPAQPPVTPPTTPPAQPPTQPTDDQRIAGVEASQRDNVVRNFEKEYGIDSLKADEKKETRKKIANYLSDFGWTINSVPLPNLSKTLDRAYVGTHAEKLREEGKLEGFRQARGTASATMPTIGGGTPAPETTEGLTTPQKKWAKALGVDETKATKGYQMTPEEEQARIPPAEQKKE